MSIKDIKEEIALGLLQEERRRRRREEAEGGGVTLVSCVRRGKELLCLLLAFLISCLSFHRFSR